MLTRLFDEIESRPLGLARLIIGAAALIRLWAAVPELLALTDPKVLLFPYADWAPVPSTPLVLGILVLWAVSALLFTFGWRVGLTGTALTLAIGTALAIDQQTYANHLYLMAWLVLLLTLAGAGSGLNVRRTDRPVVFWPVMLLMTQLSIVYAFSAVTKLNEAFLSGSVLAGYMGTGVLPFPEALRTPWILGPLAALALFVELFVAFFIWRPRFRPAAFVLGFLLHLAIALSLADTLKLVVFALEMLALYPLFLPRQRLRFEWDPKSARDATLVRRLVRLDVLRLLDPSSTNSGTVAVDEGATTGFDAIGRALERVVPTLWVAPILRLLGIRGLGRGWYRRSRSQGQPVSS